jgi:hypothetical protein
MTGNFLGCAMKTAIASILAICLPAIVFASADDLPTAQSEIIKLTDSGVEPQNLKMRLEDSIVFVLNSSTSSLMTLEVDFGGKTTHCASANMTIAQNTSLKSKRPIGPNDFASMCFHEKGSYPFTVAGLSGKTFHGTISVE